MSPRRPEFAFVVLGLLAVGLGLLAVAPTWAARPPELDRILLACRPAPGAVVAITSTGASR